MSTTESALCVCEKVGLDFEIVSVEQLVGTHRRQFAMFDLNCIMADLGDRLLFSLEGEAASVDAVVRVLERAPEGIAVATLWQSVSTGSHTGSRFTVASLRPVEVEWVAQRLAFGSRDFSDVLVCLGWAGSRSRENQLLGLAGLPFGASDPFPLAVGGVPH